VRAWHIAILAWLSIYLERTKAPSFLVKGRPEPDPPDLLAAAASDAFALLSMDETTDDQTEWQTTKPGISIHPRPPSLTSPSRI